MPTPLNQLDICNLSLSRIGAKAISSLSDLTNKSAIACNASYTSVLTEVSRAHPWNCLMRASVLSSTPQTPITATATISSTPWAPLTAYAVGVWVTLGAGTYQCLIAHTSTANFTIDLTMGYWMQENPLTTNITSGAEYASGWAYQYPLPADFLLLVELNEMAEGPQNEFEIQGLNLYTDADQAVVKYTALIDDATQYDSLFTNALSLRLAAPIATVLRQDGGQMAAGLNALYERALGEARTQDGNERKWKRYNPIQDSLFISSRWWSTNG